MNSLTSGFALASNSASSTRALKLLSRRGSSVFIFDTERQIDGLDADARLAARRELSRPLADNLHDWLLAERAKLSRHNKLARAHPARRGLGQKVVALRRFRASRTAACRLPPAAIHTLIVTAKMNDIDPQAWLADILDRLLDTPVSRAPELLPRNWEARSIAEAE